jgi:hypothetical protein
VTELGAVVDEELEGGIAIGTVLDDIVLDLASVGAADSLRISRIGLVADDLENTGWGLRGNHDVGQSHNGNGEDGLAEEHDELGWEIWKFGNWIKDRIGDRTASL